MTTPPWEIIGCVDYSGITITKCHVVMFVWRGHEVTGLVIWFAANALALFAWVLNRYACLLWWR